MSFSIARYVTKLRQEGPSAILRRRARAIWDRIRINNRTVGRLIELTGNRVRIEGMVFSLDSPIISTPQKSTIFFGFHELDERTMLNRWLPADLPVVEFGAGIGVISCLTNRKLARPDQHIVVEVNPQLIPLLERNRDRNDCQFRIMNEGLGYDSETVEIGMHANFVASRDSNLAGWRTDGLRGVTFSTPATTLKTIVETAGLDQVAVICDIEGAEAMLVDREIDTLREHARFLLVELHPRITGVEGASRILESLLSAGFTLREKSSVPGSGPYNVVLVRE